MWLVLFGLLFSWVHLPIPRGIQPQGWMNYNLQRVHCHVLL